MCWTRRTIRFPIFSADLVRVEEDRGNKDDLATRVAETAQANAVAARLLEAIRSDKRPELADYRYYALTIAANSGRVVIRDWMEGPFTELLESVNAWFDDLAIVHRYGRRVVAADKFAAVLAGAIRELATRHAPLVAALWALCIEARADSA